MRTALPPIVCFILFISVLALSVGGAPVFEDPDTAWHLAAGDLIVNHHTIPFTDPWSYTADGDRWYDLSWLSDISMSLLFSWGGFVALYVFTIGIFAASVAFMARYALIRGAGVISIFLLLLPTLLVIDGEAFARPNLYSIVLTLAFYWILHRHRTSGRLTALLPLPFLMALWVNLHGGYLLAFLLMGFFLLEAKWNRNQQQVHHLGALIALCLIASCCNPYGADIYYGAWRTLTDNFDRTYINEWQAVKIGSHLPMTLLLFVALSVSDVSDRRIPLIDRVLFIVLILFSLSSARYTTVVVLLILPYLSLRLSTVLYESRIGERVRTLEAQIMQDMQKNDIRILGWIVVSLAVLFIVTPFPRDRLLTDPIGFPAKTYPAEEAAYIESHYPKLRFFNHYNIGGYLDYLWQGRVKVFVDGRASSLYNEDVLEDYADFVTSRGFGGRAQMIKTLYNLEGLIIPNTDPDIPYWEWNPDWKNVHRGKTANVYIRSDLVTHLKSGHARHMPTVSSTK